MNKNQLEDNADEKKVNKTTDKESAEKRKEYKEKAKKHDDNSGAVLGEMNDKQ